MIIVNLSKDDLFVHFNNEVLTDDVIKDSNHMIYRTGKNDRRTIKDSSKIWIDSYETIIYRLSNLKGLIKFVKRQISLRLVQ